MDVYLAQLIKIQKFQIIHQFQKFQNPHTLNSGNPKNSIRIPNKSDFQDNHIFPKSEFFTNYKRNEVCLATHPRGGDLEEEEGAARSVYNKVQEM